MVKKIEMVPAETRWEIATNGLTGACVAYMKALRSAIGEEKFIEFQAGFWSQAGSGAKQFAESLGLTPENPTDMEEVMELLGMASMGPEFVFEIVKSTEDRCVSRAIKCPWHERFKEQGISEDYCTAGHQGWAEGGAESLNKNYSVNITKNMQCGDSYCEWVTERK